VTEKPLAAVLGLDVVGASLALALKQSGQYGAVVGWDPDHDTARRAQQQHVADRFVSRAEEAVAGAAAVFLAVGAGQVREVMAAVAPHLRPGTVVCSLSESHEATAALAQAILPPQVSFASGHPVLWEAVTAATAPSAALFQRSVFCLSPLPTAHPDAVAFLSHLASTLGADAYFVDAREHDAFFSGVGRLPAILACALLRVVSREPSWRELSRLAGGDFRQVTAPAEAEPGRQQEALAADREHVVRWLEAMVDELRRLRDALQDGQEPADFFTGAAEIRRRWLGDRQTPPAVAEAPGLPPETGRRRFPW
jgi:prephenate dehydrogenase